MASSDVQAGAAASQATPEDLILYLYVDSILRTGIISDNLTSAKSNSELVRSLESLLEHSLACPKHPSQPLPPSSSSTSSNGTSSIDSSVSLTRLPAELQECEAEPSYTYEQAKGGRAARVIIPSTDAIRQEPAVAFPETREALDVTAKFFYLPGVQDEGKEERLAMDPSWINESLQALKTATGLEEIDTFIISFPGLVFDENKSAASSSSAGGISASWTGGCDDPHARSNGTLLSSVSEEDLQSQISAVWSAASANKHLKSLGISEFSLERLQWLIAQAGKEATTGVTTTTFRKPRVGQINTRNSCDVPKDLIDYAKKEELELYVHSDCSDFLPPKTFTRLLARYGARLPAPLLSKSSSQTKADGSGAEDAEIEARQALESLSARWVLKYTVLIRDRALVADKGYIVRATRPQ